MPYTIFTKYSESIDALSAYESMSSVQCSSFSNMKKDSQKNYLAGLKRRMRDIESDSDAGTPNLDKAIALAKSLGGKSNG